MPIIKEDPLRNYDPAKFGFDSVKDEVSEGMRFDWKRDKVDDAKKRAIYDCKHYDEFKDRVAGCTLKPIHRNEFNAPPKHSFNNHVGDSTVQKPVITPLAPTAADAAAAPHVIAAKRGGAAQKVPRNGHEFERQLRRLDSADEKVELLQLVLEQEGLVAKLFGRELDGEMLRQVIAALDDSQRRGSYPGAARRLFAALAADCPASIGSACAFFDAEERGTFARLLAMEPGVDPGEDVRICAAFGISTSTMAAAAAALPAPAREVARAAPEAAAVPDATPPPKPASAPQAAPAPKLAKAPEAAPAPKPTKAPEAAQAHRGAAGGYSACESQPVSEAPNAAVELEDVDAMD